MDPRSGAILAMANWPQVNANDPGASPAGRDGEPGGRLRLRTGLDVQGGDGLRRAAAGADHAEHAASTSPTRSRSPTGRSTTTPNTPKRRSRPRRSSPSRATWARSRSACSRARNSFNGWVHRFGFGARTGVDLPGEERGEALPLSHYSGSSMGNLPIGQGELVTPMQMATAYSAIANGGILRPPHIVGAVGWAPAAGAGRASRDLSDDRRRAAPDARGRARPGRNRQRGLDPRLSAGGQDGHGQQDRPGDRRILQKRVCRLVHRLRAGVRPEAAVRGDRRRTAVGSIFGGTVAAPAFGQIMSFALPYLRIPPG